MLFWLMIIALLFVGIGMVFFVIDKVFGLTFLNRFEGSRVKYDLQKLLKSNRHLLVEGVPNDGHLHYVFQVLNHEYNKSYHIIDFLDPVVW